MKWDFKGQTGENSSRELPTLAKEYFQAGRAAARKGQSPRELHRFRVKTKRFRYALEMFRPIYGPALEARLDRLQQLQRILGKISDLYTIHELLAKDHARLKKLEAEGKQRIQEFRTHWKSTFDAPGELKAWTTALREPNASQLPENPVIAPPD